MDRLSIQSWFSALAKSDKVIVLLIVMHELTIVVRSVVHEYPHDCETRWRLAYHISEMNHAFTAAAWAMMKNEPTYPDDVLIEILLDQSNHPELEPSCRHVLERAIQLLSKQ